MTPIALNAQRYGDVSLGIRASGRRMSKNAATRKMKVFRAEGGFSVLTRVTLEQAQMREKMGIYRSEYDSSTGNLLGYRLIGQDLRKVDSDLRSTRSCPTITRVEMEMNLGRSRTRGLSEQRRLERIGRGEVPEDAVERVQAKVRVYVHVTAVKGDILRVWPR